MNSLKRFLCMALCLILMVACFTGCHEKGEIAVTVGDKGDKAFTSGEYACAFLFADMEARQKVNATLAASGVTGEVDYSKQTVDGKDYTVWVREKALEKLKIVAAVEAVCNEKKLTASTEFKAKFDAVIDMLWDDETILSLLEGNGIGKESFSKYAYYSFIYDENFFDLFVSDSKTELDLAYQNPLFYHIYGENGEKAVTDEQLTNYLAENFILVNRISVEFSGLTDEQITEKNDKFNEYAAALKDGSKTFEQVYIEYTDAEEEDHKHETKEGEVAPKDPHAILISKESSDIAYKSEYFDSVKEMAFDEVKIIELEDKKGLILVIKRDVSTDPYYTDVYDAWIRAQIIGDGLVGIINTKFASLPAPVVNEKSIKQFKVDKVFYPEVDTAY